MRYKALFLDFYGTLVHEDDAIIADINKKMSVCSKAGNPPREIGAYWRAEFWQLLDNSHGADFKTQRELEILSIQRTLGRFQCENMDINIDEVLFSHWVKPYIFEDTFPFLAQNTLPVCIVSNIDRADILLAMSFHGMMFEHIVTSEDAKSYKPRPEMFTMALKEMKLCPEQALHIGDSLSSDIAGAHRCGIDSFWLNRKARNIPEMCPATYTGNTLLDVLKLLNVLS